jgi:hypothetical protein
VRTIRQLQKPGKICGVHPKNEADVRAALDDVETGRTVELTDDELAEWERTGELPSSVQSRLAKLDG